MHTPILVSTLSDGSASARTVVLRDIDREMRQLRIHTDSRSAKIDQLRHGPECQIIAYYPEHKIQLRLDAVATIHIDDRVARDVWTDTPLLSRRSYLAQQAPGSVAGSPTSGLPLELENRVPKHAESEAGFPYFAVLLVNIQRLEWLYLAAQGHRRARFSWASGNQTTSEWLVP